MNSKRIMQIGLAIIIALLSLALVSCQKAVQVDAGIEDEEYRVMSAALKYHRYGRLYRWYIDAPRFVDSMGRTSPPSATGPRKPHEFLFARDTVRARSLFNVMNSVFGDAKYYLAVSSQTRDNDGLTRVSETGKIVRSKWPELINDLLSKNERSYELSRVRFSDSTIVALVDLEKFDEWEDFYRAMPLADGIVQLSRVGFSSEKDRAIVYRFWNAAPLGGGGTFEYLEKHDGKWSVIEIENPSGDQSN